MMGLVKVMEGRSFVQRSLRGTSHKNIHYICKDRDVCGGWGVEWIHGSDGLGEVLCMATAQSVE